MPPRHLTLAGLLLISAPAVAQQPLPTPQSLAAGAAKRFPQPVRVGDLLNRRVIQPLESQPTIGWVHDVVKRTDGSIEVVVDAGGFLHLFTRPIAVPLNAMVVIGQLMAVMDYKPDQLATFATFDGTGAMSLPPESTIQVGLAGPSH